MMNAHFEPLIPLYVSSPSDDADISLCNSFVSGSTVKPVDSLSDNSSIVINEKRRHSRRSRINDKIKTQKYREAVKKHTDKNPEVNRKAVKIYKIANPDVQRASVSRYSKNRKRSFSEQRRVVQLVFYKY